MGNYPPAGEKWLMCNNSNGKCVAAAGGCETGPGEIEFLGGIQREVQYFLGAKDNDTILEMRGPLVDLKIALGPVDCKGSNFLNIFLVDFDKVNLFSFVKSIRV